MNKNDLRYIKTEDNLRQSFLKLLQEKPLRQITVKDICTTARCSRNTFYLHYGFKEDLYEALLNEVLTSLRAAFTMNVARLSDVNDAVLRMYVDQIVDGVLPTKETLKILIRRDNGVFEQKFTAVIYDGVSHSGIGLSSKTDTPTSHLYYHYLASALTGFIFYWIGSTDLSASEVRDTLLGIHGGTMMTIVDYLNDNDSQ
ncbi:MAG TPA: hypothetical protein DCW31_02845 [Lactobacillus sp.]|nr:hypothetical protein [Lactobacillus sp.]